MSKYTKRTTANTLGRQVPDTAEVDEPSNGVTSSSRIEEIVNERITRQLSGLGWVGFQHQMVHAPADDVVLVAKDGANSDSAGGRLRSKPRHAPKPIYWTHRQPPTHNTTQMHRMHARAWGGHSNSIHPTPSPRPASLRPIVFLRTMPRN